MLYMCKNLHLFACFFFFLRRNEQKRVLSWERGKKKIHIWYLEGNSERNVLQKKKKKSNMNMRIGTKNLVLNPVCSYTHLAYIRAQLLKNIQWKLSFPSFPPFSKLVSLKKRSFKWNKKKKRKNILFSLFKRFLDP